jgi:hypothetical protein
VVSPWFEARRDDYQDGLSGHEPDRRGRRLGAIRCHRGRKGRLGDAGACRGAAFLARGNDWAGPSGRCLWRR